MPRAYSGGAVLIGVDIPGSGLLREGRHDPRTGQWAFPPSRHAGVHGLEATQTERRFDLVELDRFRYGTPAQITAWTRHLAGVEQQLRLLDADPGMLTGGTMPEYLYRRTDGVVGLLERLIEDGCREAIGTGTERLTQALLDNVTLSLPDTRSRDAGAGEIPAIPPGPVSSGGSGARKRGRSTVFDDRAPAAHALRHPAAGPASRRRPHRRRRRHSRRQRPAGPQRVPGPFPGRQSPQEPRGRRIRRYQRAGHDCSRGFRDALEPLTGRFQRTDRRARGRRAPVPQVTFAPEHIPEHLQDDWYDQHFRHIGRNTRLLRRAAALRLVQMPAGGSLAEAAAFLGIDHRYLKASPGSAAFTDDPADFRLAVHALARQLSATPDLINYQHRRDTLRDWQDIISQLPPAKGPFQPELSDCKRQFASEAVWARITQGEHLLAPGSSRTRLPAVTPPGTDGVTTCGTSTTPARPNRTTPP